MTRQFSAEPVAAGLVDELLDLARRAPSAGFSQGVHFVVLEGDAIERFWDVTGAREWFAGSQPALLVAPVIVLPVALSAEYLERYSQPDKAGHGLEDAANWPIPFWLTDATMAVQNLLLLLEDRGLGALYFGIFGNEAGLLAELGAPEGARAVGAVALGYRAGGDRPSGSPRTRRRRPLSEVVHHQHW